MSVDGMIERAAIVARLQTLAGGRVYRGIPDDETHARFSGGEVRPYYAITFGVPYPVERGKTMGAGDRQTPHIMRTTIIAFAGDQETAEQAGADGRNLLRDWQATATCTPLASLGGANGTNSDGKKKPTRFDETSFFTTIINMGPDA